MASFKLTKDQLQLRDKLIAELTKAQEKLTEAVVAFNGSLTNEQQIVEEAVLNYNTALHDAREFCEDVASQADQDISDRSEKWQEGDKGQAAIEFRDAWQQMSLNDIDVEYPKELDIEEPSHADDLGNAPEEA